MRKLVIVAAAFLSATSVAASSDRSITAACTPTVNVTIPRTAAAQKSRAPREQRSEVVQVYWDVSKSMRDFAADLAAVVNALDSNVLLQAHAKSVEQYGVGESIATLPSARPALSPNANRTMLHLAAEKSGAALASGLAQAALIVSDLELDTPPRSSKNAAVCGGVPLPSTPEAGSLFGRCFENAVLASGDAALTRKNLLVHVFRKSSHGRELFILLLAADRDFGRRISDEVVRRIGFERQVIFDSGAVAAANVRGCRLNAPSEEMLRTAGGCNVKCFDADAAIHAECDIQRTGGNAWIVPVASAADGIRYEPVKRKAGDSNDRAVARFSIPCTAPAGVFDAAVAYSWQVRARSDSRAFAQKASVRDLFDSLDDAIVRVVAPRTLRIGIHLAP
jgi:hypothetical protein